MTGAPDIPFAPTSAPTRPEDPAASDAAPDPTARPPARRGKRASGKAAASLPGLRHEVAAGAPALLVAGIDEAGRGPLAGPVMAAAVVLPPWKTRPELPAALAAINDSKALTRGRRAILFDAIQETCDVGVGQASVAEIDAVNILNATFLAMVRAVERLPNPAAHALIDGNRVPPGLTCPGTAIIGGDGLSASIAAASIIAKVTRDRIMWALADAFPAYSWQTNVGYPSKAHWAAIRRHGVTPHHRLSFASLSEQKALEV